MSTKPVENDFHTVARQEEPSPDFAYRISPLSADDMQDTRPILHAVSDS
jgi:DNA polymerase III epsilon subunit-like protein